MSEIRRLLITVKTYPTLSRKYDELVCTAGILDDGNWARIYPLPFRKMDYDKKFKKYQWIELELEKNTEDPRPETYRPVNYNEIKLIGDPIGTDASWEERKKIIFRKNSPCTDLEEVIDKAKKNELSLALFKPTGKLRLVIEKVSSEWDEKKLQHLKKKQNQLSLLHTAKKLQHNYSIGKKLPYKFSYRFEDCNGKKRKLMIEDWEIGALYWNCLKRAKGDETQALEAVKKRYEEEFNNKDIYLFLGTTKQWHSISSNPFLIIGVFYPPVQKQLRLS